MYVVFLLVGFVPHIHAAKAPATIAAIDSVRTDSTKLANKVVYIDFWASWCAPCRKSFPWMKEMMEKYKKEGLQIVTVNLDKERAAAKKFLDDMNSPLEVVYDSTGSLAKLYALEAMPTSFIYGRDGKLRTHHLGFYPKDAAELESLIRSLLEDKQQK